MIQQSFKLKSLKNDKSYVLVNLNLLPKKRLNKLENFLRF